MTMLYETGVERAPILRLVDVRTTTFSFLGCGLCGLPFSEKVLKSGQIPKRKLC